MAEDTGQERTEEATPRRRQQAREEGQVARSRELNTMLVLMIAAGAGAFLGPELGRDMAQLFHDHLSIAPQDVYDPGAIIRHLSGAIFDMVSALAPFFLVTVVAAIGGPLLMGGVNFSSKALAFKWDKLDPVKGLKRVFAMRGLIELLKALAKFAIIGVVAVFFLTTHMEEFFGLGAEPLREGIMHTFHLMLWALLAISSSLILIALVDVPFQLWDHGKQLRMTKQEVKDDTKDTEGSPELRGQIRRMQREMAQRRMMEEVPKADVVITNPQHYAVALKYDQDKPGAPKVVALGVDRVALRIREVAREHEVVIVAAPPLARAIYHSTDLNEEIPVGLYLAVAQILAYVFQLRAAGKKGGAAQKEFTDLPIPEDYRHDK